MSQKSHTNNGKSNEPEVEIEEGSERVLINLYIEKDQRDWLRDRKKHGESASTVMRTLLRKAMAEDASVQTA